MVTIVPDCIRNLVGTWDCLRCGRRNHDRHAQCASCGRSSGGAAGERPVIREARPLSGGAWVPSRSSRSEVRPGRPGPDRSRPEPDAAALAALSSLLTAYEQWLAVTRDPYHRLQLLNCYALRVPEDVFLVGALSSELSALVLRRLRQLGREDLVEDYEAVLAELRDEVEALP